MKNRLMKAVLSACMLFTIQAGTMVNVHANEEQQIPDGTYTVSTKLMNSTNITSPSMASGSLAEKGSVEIKDGKWYLIAEFQTLDFGGMGSLFGNASEIKYYETSDLTQEPKDAEIVSYRQNATVIQGNEILKNQEAVEKVRIPLVENSTGVYINMLVDFMGTHPDAYIAFDLKEGIHAALTTEIANAKAYKEKEYSAETYQALQAAIQSAEEAIAQNRDETTLANQLTLLKQAVENLAAPEKIYPIADGTYQVSVDVLKENSDQQSMAASAVKSAVITVKNGMVNVELEMGAVSVYGQTAYVDKVEFETTAGVYEEATITEKDDAGHMSKLAFTLAKNTKYTNVKFYYGGSNRGAAARLALGLDQPVAISTSKFASDGTYQVAISLWNAAKDEPSMAAAAINPIATVVVKDSKATMYIETKKMTLGTIVAYLQEMKIGDNDAKVVQKDAQGNPTMFAFELPNEEELLDVQVNPHVAIMGNAFIPARIKIDYASLEKVSDAVTAPSVDQSVEQPTQQPTPQPEQQPGKQEEADQTGNENQTPVITAPSTTVEEAGTTTVTSTASKGSVQTSDPTNAAGAAAILLASLGVMVVLNRKRIWQQEK